MNIDDLLNRLATRGADQFIGWMRVEAKKNPAVAKSIEAFLRATPENLFEPDRLTLEIMRDFESGERSFWLCPALESLLATQLREVSRETQGDDTLVTVALAPKVDEIPAKVDSMRDQAENAFSEDELDESVNPHYQ